MEDLYLDSKEVMENIDLEEGKIKVRGEWLTEDELRYAIRMKVDSDDYNVADLAVALKTLISEMNKSTVMRVRVPKELAESFEDISKQRGHSVESMLRTILLDFINQKEESLIPVAEEATEELEAEIVDIIQGNVTEEEEEGDDIEIVSNRNIDRQLLDMESTTVDSEPEDEEEEEMEEDVSEIEDLDRELEEELKEFEPTPEAKPQSQKRVLRRKKVKRKRR
jgi:hypothetical protein